MAAVYQPGLSGQDDVTIENSTTVGDFQSLLTRAFVLIDRVTQEAERHVHGAEQQFAQVRADLQVLRTQGQQAQAQDRGPKIDLIDVKAMSPATFSGDRVDNFKIWAKKVKAFTNAKLTGYRRALEFAEELPKGTPVDQEVLGAWQWGDAVMADSKLHDMLLLITGGEAQGIVEQVPGRGFEAWRLLNERFNSTGELYTFDKMNAIMKQTHKA